MRQTEVAYWDTVAEHALAGGLGDNWHKRQALLGHLLRYSWIHERVLEVGTGAAVTAAGLKFACGGLWEYTGTELSQKFQAQAKMWKLHVVQADILSLPRGTYTRVLALDSLEHVRPEDRPQGFSDIASMMEPSGLLFINIPLDSSKHEDEFDHGFGLKDLLEFEKHGLVLSSYEGYNVAVKTNVYTYAMAVMMKR